MGYVVPARHPGLATFAEEAAGSLDLLLAAAVAASDPPAVEPFVGATVLAVVNGERPPALIVENGAEIMASARQVGVALAGLHDALARRGDTLPVPYTSLDRRALYQGTRTLLGEAVAALRDPAVASEAPDTGPLAEALVAARPAIDARLRLVLERPFDGLRIPPYGGPVTASRVLRDGGRHVIGVPERDHRPAVDRTRLRSPLLDVAAILASLRTITLRPSFGGDAERRGLRPEDARRTEGWARTWWAHVGAALVGGYLAALTRPALLPSSDDDRALLLDVHFAGLALEEILRPTRAGQPPDPASLVALLDLAGASPGGAAT
jgi:predicted trehalose synthase